MILFSGCEIKLDDDTDEEITVVFEEEELTPYPVVINDVEIEREPDTIISLSPALAELVFEFDAGEKLIGRGSYCDFPAAVAEKPDVGSSANPDIEKIIKLKPDVLLISTPLAAKDLLTMEQHGIKTLLFISPRSLDEFKRIYEAMGILLRGKFTGTEVGEEIFSAISKVCDNSDVVYVGNFIYITEDLKTAGGDTLEHAVFSCFGNNLAKDQSDYSQDAISFEARQPDVILLSNKYTKEDLAESAYAGLDAVKNGKIIYIDNLYFERPTGRVLILIEKFLSDFLSL